MKKPIVLAALTIALATGAQAASISSAGTLTDLTPPGRGTGTDVADLDAQNVGVDGFVVFNTIPEGGNVSNALWDLNIVDSKPAYVTALDGGTSTSSGGWANYDDVLIGGTTYNTGGIVRGGVGNGVEAQMFTFTVGPGVPSTLLIGLITGNSDSNNWDVSDVRVEGPGGVTANQAQVINGGTNLAQFEITGALDGEIYTVYGTAPPSGALIAGITFDTGLDITDPTDTDGDTIGDNWEIFYFGDITVTDGTGDFDLDGLTDLQEWQEGTLPKNSDTDGDGLTDGDEVNTHMSDPLETDTDGDGYDDGYEVTNSAAGFDPLVDSSSGDADSDGLNNGDELVFLTDALDPDSDDDGVTDGDEVSGDANPYTLGVLGATPGDPTDPLDPDSDFDGVSDGDELSNTNGSVTDPNNFDTDSDGLEDGFEINGGLDPTDPTGDNGDGGDPDSDGLDNLGEQFALTDPSNPDTDADGLLDGVEDDSTFWTSATQTGTSPLNPDSDGDGLLDGVENHDLPYDSLNPTTQPGSDPNLTDTDGDGADDGLEIANGTDPTDAGSVPVPPANLWSVDIQGIPGVFPSSPVLMTGNEPNSGIVSGIWNAFDLPGHDGTAVDPSLALVDAYGVAGSVTISVFGTVSSWTNAPGADSLSNDYMFVNAGNAAASATWELSGLTPMAEYTFYPYGGIARDMGLTVDTNGDGSLADETLTSVPGTGLEFTVTAGADGKIIGSIEAGNSGEANWGGFQLLLNSSPPFIDTDGDGLSDTQEDTLGTDRFNPDTDGDGQSDGDEVLYAGTDPLDANSLLKLTDVEVTDGAVSLTWTSVPGKIYAFEGSVDGEMFTSVGTPTGADVGATTTAEVDTVDGIPFTIYRVVVPVPTP